jgi:hypothetical protein
MLTGTTVAVQTADNQAVSDTDLTDTFINAPVRTISGQQGVAIQLIDQSPIAFDDVVFRDLVAAHAAVLESPKPPTSKASPSPASTSPAFTKRLPTRSKPSM